MNIPNTEPEYGPTLSISEEIHAMKYRSKGESFKEAMTRVALPFGSPVLVLFGWFCLVFWGYFWRAPERI